MRLTRSVLLAFFLLVPTSASFAKAGRAPIPGDVVNRWNELALEAVRATAAPDAAAARSYAMLNAGMYDAVWGIEGKSGPARGQALVAPVGAPPSGDVLTAATRAAHDLLGGLFPDRLALFDAQLAKDAAASPCDPGGRVAAGNAWGAEVARQILATRTGDAAMLRETQQAGSGPGQFPLTWANTQFRTLAPFAIADPSVYVGAGPPALTTLDYAAALAEVRVLGNQALADPDKLATFQFWSLGSGTDQPPGAWLQIALIVGAARQLPLDEMTRLCTLVTLAMADTVAPTYQAKFQFHAWRPTSAIRAADTDDNPLTEPDPSWTARAGAPGANPEHWSGHSSFSAAAAAALAGFFCRDDVAFRFASDSSAGGLARDYPSFSAAMKEAGRSRVFGGLHFELSNQRGLEVGHAVAAEVLAGKLLRTGGGATHFGACPL